MSNVIGPWYDRQRCTCIQVNRTATHVEYVPFEVLGLSVHRMTITAFEERYKPMVGYAPEQACQLYLKYAETIGATNEVLKYLGQVINIDEKDVEMANAKAKTASKKTPAKAKTKATAKGKAAAAPKIKAAKSNGNGSITAARMFQDLIMVGKHTDAEIFAKVQAEFNLDDKKKTYVKWYRNYLTKQGKNPPDAR